MPASRLTNEILGARARWSPNYMLLAPPRWLIGCCKITVSTTIADRGAVPVLQCRIMNKVFVLGLIAGTCLTGCNKSSSPSFASAPKPDDSVQRKLKEMAGQGATDCGRLDVRAANEQMTGASTCATKAAEAKHPFYLAYDMPGMTTGVAGSSDGKLFTLELQGSGTGAKLASGPCPAALRIAPSGRLTCFIPGTMGLNPTAADPHSGIAVNPGAGSPQGGMGIPQPFAPAPNAGAPKPAPKGR
jgi:hypothetical protein